VIRQAITAARFRQIRVLTLAGIEGGVVSEVIKLVTSPSNRSRDFFPANQRFSATPVAQLPLFGNFFCALLTHFGLTNY
jgi:hypothetical protein